MSPYNIKTFIIMKNPFRKDRKSKLQDCDVREIAKMQTRRSKTLSNKKTQEMKKNKEEEQNHQHKQVRVYWADSIIGESAWTLELDFEDEEPAKVTTLGFIVAEDECHLTIAQNLIHEPSTQFSNIITIPKCSITKTEEL